MCVCVCMLVCVCVCVCVCLPSFLQFEELERLGYRGIALGFFEDDIQAAFTHDCACCVTPSTVQYIRALSIAGTATY